MDSNDIKRLKELMELRADETLAPAARAAFTHDLQFHLLHFAPALLAAYEDAERWRAARQLLTTWQILDGLDSWRRGEGLVSEKWCEAVDETIDDVIAAMGDKP